MLLWESTLVPTWNMIYDDFITHLCMLATHPCATLQNWLFVTLNYCLAFRCESLFSRKCQHQNAWLRKLQRISAIFSYRKNWCFFGAFDCATVYSSYKFLLLQNLLINQAYKRMTFNWPTILTGSHEGPLLNCFVFKTVGPLGLLMTMNLQYLLMQLNEEWNHDCIYKCTVESAYNDIEGKLQTHVILRLNN